MALITRRSQPHGSIPTSSMADVAFLLLVFFLVTTVFPKDRGLALVLPDGETPVSRGNVLHLLVRPVGLVEVRLGESANSQLVDTEAVDEIWRRAVAVHPFLIAAVKTSPEASYGRTIDVLDRLQAAGARRISLQALPN